MAATDVDVPFVPADRAVYLPEADALVLADTHFGRGAASNVDAPIDAAGDVTGRLVALLDRFEPDTVVVAGDLLHSFSWVPRGVRRSLREFVDSVASVNATLVITPGNHDTMLKSVLCDDPPSNDSRSVADERVEYDRPECRLADGSTVVLHGHEPPETSATRYVIGHDHPALSVGGQKHPCYLYGPSAYRDTPSNDAADVLVLPAFTTLARGTTVNRLHARDFQSPIVTDAGAFHPGVRDEARDETLWFPSLRQCRRLL